MKIKVSKSNHNPTKIPCFYRNMPLLFPDKQANFLNPEQTITSVIIPAIMDSINTKNYSGAYLTDDTLYDNRLPYPRTTHQHRR